MGFAFLPFAFFTMLWGGVGIGLPIFLPKGENKGLIQLALVLTAATCYLFWLCTYMAQMNPLIGPKLKKTTLLMLAQEWCCQIKSLLIRRLTSKIPWIYHKIRRKIRDFYIKMVTNYIEVIRSRIYKKEHAPLHHNCLVHYGHFPTVELNHSAKCTKNFFPNSRFDGIASLA